MKATPLTSLIRSMFGHAAWNQENFNTPSFSLGSHAGIATLFVSLIVSAPAHGRPDARKSATSLSDLVAASAQFMIAEQKTAPDGIYIEGEWPSQIESTLVPIVAGVGRPIGVDEEASAFTTASVMNQLATLYLENPHLKLRPELAAIPAALKRAGASLERYREGDLYNFYPARMWKGVRVHQPADMSLTSIWKGFTNIPEDADTTSVVYAAKQNLARVEGTSTDVPGSVLSSFAKFRDLDREPHFYNKREHQRDTGAFMTWQMDEHDPKMPRFPFSPPQAGIRIPFNVNDVDCIVNLNVLRMLALSGHGDTDGRRQSCDYINDVIRRKQQATCGIYYPNTYHVAYSTALLERAGGACLTQDSKNRVVRAILEGQSADGGWDNTGNVWNDRIHATAYAIAALNEFTDPSEPGPYAAMVAGTSFLIHEMKTTRGGLPYWQSEGFFTATALARSLIMWRSEAYTTGVVANVLAKVEARIPEKTLADYIRIGNGMANPFPTRAGGFGINSP